MMNLTPLPTIPGASNYGNTNVSPFAPTPSGTSRVPPPTTVPPVTTPTPPPKPSPNAAPTAPPVSGNPAPTRDANGYPALVSPNRYSDGSYVDYNSLAWQKASQIFFQDPTLQKAWAAIPDSWKAYMQSWGMQALYDILKTRTNTTDTFSVDGQLMKGPQASDYIINQIKANAKSGGGYSQPADTTPTGKLPAAVNPMIG